VENAKYQWLDFCNRSKTRQLSVKVKIIIFDAYDINLIKIQPGCQTANLCRILQKDKTIILKWLNEIIDSVNYKIVA
jgi:hypothetical protein